MLSFEEREYNFRVRLDQEESGQIHPDGCLYCGESHLTGACHDNAPCADYWALENEVIF
jgi:hypothetical protein